MANVGLRPSCRFCGATLRRTFVDLGEMPLANGYLSSPDEVASESRYPLCARVCGECLLVQVDAVVDTDVIFSDYPYFSSYSATWSEHARRFAEETVCRLGLGPKDLVVEVASNDGYLLRHFRDAGVEVLGIEPAVNVAKAAIECGVPTEVAFFGLLTAERLLSRGRHADLLIGNNVFAHVPDINDFAAGLARTLDKDGVLSMEFPHLLRLIQGVQFDTIYHEHFSYLSLLTAERVLMAHGLTAFDVEELPTHGGSLRLWAAHADRRRTVSPRLLDLRTVETGARLHEPQAYSGFSVKVERCRRSMLDFLTAVREAGDTVVAYGAAAKGNTLLNYCGVTTEDVAYVVDRSPHKQGRLLPGSHLPIYSPDRIDQTRPAYVLVLPWNLREEICGQMSHIREWGGRFVFPVPEVEIA